MQNALGLYWLMSMFWQHGLFFLMHWQKTLQCVCHAAFCYLVFLKILGIHSFQQEVALFGDAYLGEWIRDFSFQLAVGVCVVEIFLGMFLLCRKLMLLASTLAVFILLFFVYLTGRNFLYPTMMGSIESCGCFGELVHFSPLGAFIKSLVLFVVSLVNLFLVLKLRVKMLI